MRLQVPTPRHLEAQVSLSLIRSQLQEVPDVAKTSAKPGWSLSAPPERAHSPSSKPPLKQQAKMAEMAPLRSPPPPASCSGVCFHLNRRPLSTFDPLPAAIDDHRELSCSRVRSMAGSGQERTQESEGAWDSNHHLFSVPADIVVTCRWLIILKISKIAFFFFYLFHLCLHAATNCEKESSWSFFVQ